MEPRVSESGPKSIDSPFDSPTPLLLPQENKTSQIALPILKKQLQFIHDNCRRCFLIRLFINLFKNGDAFEKNVEKPFNAYIKLLGSKKSDPQKVTKKYQTMVTQFAKYLADFKSSGNKDVDETRIQTGLDFIFGENHLAKEAFRTYFQAVQTPLDSPIVLAKALSFLGTVETEKIQVDGLSHDGEDNKNVKILVNTVFNEIQTQLPLEYTIQSIKDIFLAKTADDPAQANTLFDEFITDNFLAPEKGPLFNIFFNLIHKFGVKTFETEGTRFLYVLHIGEKLQKGVALEPYEIQTINKIFGAEVIGDALNQNACLEMFNEAIKSTFLDEGAPQLLNIEAKILDQAREGTLSQAKSAVEHLFRTNTIPRLRAYYLESSGPTVGNFGQLDLRDANRMKAILYLASPSSSQSDADDVDV